MVVLAVDFLVGETQVIFHCAAGGIQQEQVPQPIRLEAVNASGLIIMYGPGLDLRTIVVWYVGIRLVCWLNNASNSFYDCNLKNQKHTHTQIKDYFFYVTTPPRPREFY